jgi:hypothetical protein
MPQTNPHLPCLLSQSGGPHPALFTNERIDSDFEELCLSFSGDSLLSATDEIVVKKFEGSVKTELSFDFERGGEITSTFRYRLKDGRQGSVVEQFDFPRPRDFRVTLIRCTAHVQQVQIANPFPARFHFVCDGRRHVLNPLGAYDMVRRVGGGPLDIDVHEEGWEGLERRLRVEFEPEDVVVRLSVDVGDWMAGECRLVRLDKPAEVLGGGEDWVAAAIDVDRRVWALVPKHPGRLWVPMFVVGNRAVKADVAFVDVTPRNVTQVLWV